MNDFTAIFKIASTPEMRYTSESQTPVVTLNIELMTRYGDSGSFTINCVAFGKVADSIANMEQGAIVMAVGQLNILSVDRGDFKEYIASFKISEIVAEMPTLIPFNKISILGNVGGEVDSKYFDSGKNNAKFSLAVRRTAKETDWFAIECWSDTAKVCDQYVAKGSKVGASGHLKIETWTDKNTGQIRSKPVIVADRVSLAGKGGDGATEQRAYQSAAQPATVKSSNTPPRSSGPSTAKPKAAEPDFDDIPF